MNAKRFFYVAAGILLLVVAYSIGAHQAGAQSGGNFVGIASGGSNSLGGPIALVSITDSGDWYYQGCNSSNWPGDPSTRSWTYGGNILSGPTQVENKGMSDVKSLYRK